MAASLGSGSLKLTADTTGLIEGVTQGLTQAKDIAINMSTNISSGLTTTFGSIKNKVATAVAAAGSAVSAAATGITIAFGAAKDGLSWVTSTFNEYKDEIIDLAKTAANLNLPIGELQGFHHAAAKSGSDAHNLNLALKNLAETGEDAFHFADRIKNMPLLQQMQELQKLGRGGWQLRSMFAGGAEELRKVVDEGKQLTSALSDADAKAVRAASAMTSQAKAIVKGLWQQLVVALSPIVESRFKAWRDWMIEMRPILLSIIQAAGAVASSLGAMFSTVLGYGKAIMGIFTGDFQVTSEGIIEVARQAALVVGNMMDGAIVATGYLTKGFAALLNFISPVIDVLYNLGYVGVQVGKMIFESINLGVNAIIAFGTTIVTTTIPMLFALGTTAVGVVGAIIQSIPGLATNLLTVFTLLIDKVSELTVGLKSIGLLIGAVVTQWGRWLGILATPTPAGNQARKAASEMTKLGAQMQAQWGITSATINGIFDDLQARLRKNQEDANKVGNQWQGQYQASAALIQGSKEALSAETKFKVEGLLNNKPEDIARAQLAEQQGIRRDVQDVAAAVRDIKFEFEVI